MGDPDKLCKTCKWFLKPQSWRNSYNYKGICEIATPSIPRSIEWKRMDVVGEEWDGCPCWSPRQS